MTMLRGANLIWSGGAKPWTNPYDNGHLVFHIDSVWNGFNGAHTSGVGGYVDLISGNDVPLSVSFSDKYGDVSANQIVNCTMTDAVMGAFVSNEWTATYLVTVPKSTTSPYWQPLFIDGDGLRGYINKNVYWYPFFGVGNGSNSTAIYPLIDGDNLVIRAFLRYSGTNSGIRYLNSAGSLKTVTRTISHSGVAPTIFQMKFASGARIYGLRIYNKAMADGEIDEIYSFDLDHFGLT